MRQLPQAPDGSTVQLVQDAIVHMEARSGIAPLFQLLQSCA